MTLKDFYFCQVDASYNDAMKNLDLCGKWYRRNRRVAVKLLEAAQDDLHTVLWLLNDPANVKEIELDGNKVLEDDIEGVS
jgi:hypothetical protein